MGKEIKKFILKNNVIEVHVLNYGLIISHCIVKDIRGNAQDVVLGFESPDGYLSESYQKNYNYMGAIIGRNANRIYPISFWFEEELWELSQNFFDCQLHGGTHGFDRKYWDYLPERSVAEKKAVFSYFSQHEEEGFKGNLTVFAYVEIDNNALNIRFEATTDQSTLINLTHHSYFNLNPNQSTVHEHYAKINARNYLEQNDIQLPTGSIVPVKDTVLDFTSFRKINDMVCKPINYDYSFVLEPSEKDLLWASTTYSPVTGIVLQCFTNQPVLHFYTAEGNSVLGGKNNVYYGPYSGFCLETQGFTNAINCGFPLPVLNPGELYVNDTKYVFSTLDEVNEL